MPYGKGTYGSKVGRPKKSTTAKRLSPGQKKIARQAGNPNKIDSADFKKLRSRRGMK
jgi:hypothetical protein|tara:strand:- start:2858 stop:3028 length:171 start_codon:yes stop_codon:yes gene_type:complete